MIVYYDTVGGSKIGQKSVTYYLNGPLHAMLSNNLQYITREICKPVANEGEGKIMMMYR
jgi:hypothetical protein